MKERLAEKIAGEIVLSENPGQTIRKWRETFRISQQELAKHLKVSSSVISDYEGGRRKSPGVVSVRKIVDGLIKLDETKGGQVLRQYTLGETTEAIFAIREFPIGMPATKFVDAIKGKVVASEKSMKRDIHGYTVIDSIRAITSLSAFDYLKVYGWSSERALIFTGVKYGRSPMVAIRAHPMKPAMVVYHKPEKVDELAIRLANVEQIPLVTTQMPLQTLLGVLKEI